ncbi:UNVERIFIED_CONTAM: Pentatricopeptide repeat-containing protein [Sesamum calycinum]|uniref:Pentatricopeptide repeat-containing protein n=1 Tax=Sesamum calycinum TaxID=2727403 RepID=A0AAW2ITI4_9LAMI
MVDLYGRAGLLKKAKEIILRMPYKPTSEMWATLLEQDPWKYNIGEWAAEAAGNEARKFWVLCVNCKHVCCCRCWSKLARVRTVMRDLGVRKDPGCAWVDMGAGFSPLVEDTSKGQTTEILSSVGGLTKQMKSTDSVASEAEEEIFLGLLS